MGEPSVAVVHEWIYNYTGSERVVEQILHLYPESDLFVLFDFLPDDRRGFLLGRTVHTSFLQSMPFTRRNHRWTLPLMPAAVRGHDLSNHDLVLSSSHAVAKGVRTRPDQLHISYVHTPMRYVWDLSEDYFPGIRRRLAAPLISFLRHWDRRVTEQVQVLVANSANVGRRIRRCYGRDAQVIYPPVDVEAFEPKEQREDFYLSVSRLVPYKNIDLIVRAFSELGYPLVVIGEGPEAHRIESLAGPNIELLGFRPDAEVRDYMNRCKAFIFAAEEDFGITPVEAQAAGAPVIAFRAGGALETVIEGKTGLFFDRLSVDDLVGAVRRFEARLTPFRQERLISNASRFGIDRFRAEYGSLVERAWDAFSRRADPHSGEGMSL